MVTPRWLPVAAGDGSRQRQLVEQVAQAVGGNLVELAVGEQLLDLRSPSSAAFGRSG